MPSVTEKQRRFIAEFERLRAGMRTRTQGSERRLIEFARTPARGADIERRPQQRRSHATPATLLMRRLRFGSEWL